MADPFGTNFRDRVAVHEAGHAVVGTLIYGPGFVTKVRIKQGYGVTNTNGNMKSQPQNIWDGTSLVSAHPKSTKIETHAIAMQSMAGMAAEALIFGAHGTARDDVALLNSFLEENGLRTLHLNDPDLAVKLLATSPYREGFCGAVQLLQQNVSKFEPVRDWLLKTDSLQGHEVEKLMDGQPIRCT